MPSNPAHPIEKSLVSNPPDGASVPTSASASATGDSGAQAKGMFDQVTSAVSVLNFSPHREWFIDAVAE